MFGDQISGTSQANSQNSPHNIMLPCCSSRHLLTAVALVICTAANYYYLGTSLGRVLLKDYNTLAVNDAPQLKTDRACNDTALYYNINSKSWGVFSRTNATVESAINGGDNNNVLWFVANWISEPTVHKILKHLTDKGLLMERDKRLWAQNRTIKLLITDSADMGSGYYMKGYPLFSTLEKAAQIIGPANVYIAARKLVQNRDFSCFKMQGKKYGCNYTTQFGALNGTMDNITSIPRLTRMRKHVHDGIVAKWDFPIRKDLLREMDRIVRENLGVESISTNDYFLYPRVYDVCHLWTINRKDKFGMFRNMVTQAVGIAMKKHNLTGTAGLVSERGKKGRTTVSRAYANALLEHKIVVVSQRDFWEDHLRLMEGLMSGALVMSDPITHLPAGLKENESIVIYNSLEELEQKILYYLRDGTGTRDRLRISQAGRMVALNEHQGHHLYERLMLGENWPRDQKYPVAPVLNCPRVK